MVIGMIISFCVATKSGPLFLKDESDLKLTSVRDDSRLSADANSTNSSDSMQTDETNNVVKPGDETNKGDNTQLNKSDDNGKPVMQKDNKNSIATEQKPIEKKEEGKEKEPIVAIKDQKRHYVAFIAGYGGFFPVADFGKSYLPAHMGSFSIPIYYLTLWGFCRRSLSDISIWQVKRTGCPAHRIYHSFNCSRRLCIGMNGGSRNHRNVF